MRQQSKLQLSKKLLLLYSILIAISALIVNQLIPWLKFDLNANATHIKLPRPPTFDVNLSDNAALQRAKFLLKSQIRGADSIVVANQKIYTGLLNGTIIQIDIQTHQTQILTHIGLKNDDICNHNGIYFDAKRECGRPLGIRYKEPKWLYVIDSFNGLLKVDINTGVKYELLNVEDERFGEFKPKYLNDLDVDSDGNVYFTDSSFRRNLNEAVELFVEGNPDGRLYVLNEHTNTLSLLLDNIHFANGVQLINDGEALLVAETAMARILKIFLKGPKKGELIILMNLPGFPDNIRLTSSDTLLVAFAAVRQPNRFIRSLMDSLGEYPKIRETLALIFNLRAIRSHFVPKYGLIAEYDVNGTLIHSWHDSTGQYIECTSSAIKYNNKLYIGSFNQDFIAIVDA